VERDESRRLPFLPKSLEGGVACVNEPEGLKLCCSGLFEMLLSCGVMGFGLSTPVGVEAEGANPAQGNPGNQKTDNATRTRA